MNGAPGVLGQRHNPSAFRTAAPIAILDALRLGRFLPSRHELVSFRKFQKRRLSRPIGESTTLVIGDGLPQLDAISFGVSEPAKLPEVVGFAIWIDCDTFAYQAVQHTIEVIDLEIDH